MINLVKTSVAKSHNEATTTAQPSARFNLVKGNNKGLRRFNLKKD